jgi:hypothetical protein
MPRLLFFTLLLIIPTSGISQTPTLLNEYSSPISNKNYKIGDSILIGVPNYAKNETFLYKNVFIEQRNLSYFDQVMENLSKHQGVIEKIYSNQDHVRSEFKNSVVFEIKIKGHANLFIPIDKAIISKEVVVFPNPNSSLEYLPFNDQTATILQIKAGKLSPETAMLTYMEKLETKKYEEWKNDEFLYQAEKEQYIRVVDSILKMVSIGDTLILILPVEMGDYDFDSNSFPVVETFSKFGETVAFVFSNEKMTFKNYAEFSTIPVPRNKAEFLAKSSTKSYIGTQSVYVLLRVKVADVLLSEQRGGMNIGSNIRNVVDYFFSIVDMDCVDSEALEYNYLGE